MSDFTFTEHGEDLLIHRLLLWKESGFYVDCGAFHTRKMSMTARLRNFGWTGINIDADREVIQNFQSDLPHMINICAAIGEEKGQAILYRYQDPVLNTIDSLQHHHLQAIENRGELFTHYIGQEVVKTTSLSTILEEIGVSDGKVDFLNLDIEGVELTALKGFPWSSQQPRVITVEIHRLVLKECSKHPVVQFMATQDYVMQSYVFHTAIFVPKEFDTELCHLVVPKAL